MKRSLILLALLALAGCSNLNVSWQLTASYNQAVQQQTLMIHTPKAAEEAKPAETVPPALPPAGKAS